MTIESDHGNESAQEAPIRTSKLDRKTSGGYIDLRFSDPLKDHYRSSAFDGYNSDDFIDMWFSKQSDLDAFSGKLEGFPVLSDVEERNSNFSEKTSEEDNNTQATGIHKVKTQEEIFPTTAKTDGSDIARKTGRRTIKTTKDTAEKRGTPQLKDDEDAREKTGKPRVKNDENNSETTGMQHFKSEFKDMAFPRVSEGTLRVDVEDFYSTLTAGLDSLTGLAESAFLNNEFLQKSVSLMGTLDGDVRILMEKLADLKHPSSLEVSQTITEYTNISGKILKVCNSLKFCTTLLKAYQSCQVESSVVALEALVSLPKSCPRAMHVIKAKAAGLCLDSAQAEIIQMRLQVQKLVESGSYGSLSYFVPNLNILDAKSDFERSRLGGVLFAMKTTCSYISQLLLAGLADAGDGPALILPSTPSKSTSLHYSWASSLVGLHIRARKQFNKMKDGRECSCTFMSSDSDRLEFMLEDVRGHLRSLLDQGKFLNMGVYLNSWLEDKKKLVHNVPQLRRHLLLSRRRRAELAKSIDCVASTMIEGQRYLAQL